MREVKYLVVFLFALFCSANLYAQSSGFTGTVTDSTGASIAGAEVTATQVGTAETRTVTTNADGSYTIPQIPAGEYQITVKKDGFQSYTQTGITLQVSSNPTVNVVLQVGAVTQEVTVTSNAAIVETHSSTIGQVVDQQQVIDIPLNSRDPLQLLTLTPAAVNTASGNGATGAYTFPTAFVVAFAGTAPSQGNYWLDGGSNFAHHSSGPYPLPFPDALQEFNVVTSAVPAQYGGHASTTVNAIVKSGTNSFHGDAFEFVRNGDFNARQFYQALRDPLKRNQFGGIIGGPVVKDKMFFFFAYQDTILRDQASATAILPTPAELAGNFQTALSPTCNNNKQLSFNTLPGTINSGTTTAPVLNPLTYALPSTNLVSHLPPLPANDPCGNITYSYRVATTLPEIVGKVDYHFNDKHSIYGRYFLADYTLAADYTNWLTANQPSQHDKYQTFTMGDTYLISPTVVNSIHGNVNRDVSAKGNNPGDLTPSQLGVAGNYYNPINGYTVVNVAGDFNVKSVVAANPLQFNETDFQFTDDLSISKGSHQIGIGINFEHQNQDYISSLYINGQFTFTTATTGFAMADFLLGDASTFAKGDLITGHMRKNYYGAYIQDSWQFNRKLTLNYGVRYEPFTPTHSSDGRSYFFSLPDYLAGVTSHVYFNAPAGLLFPSPQAGIAGDYPGFGNSYIGDMKHFEPRLGLSYDPTGKGRMVVRASYGVFYDYEGLEQRENLQQGPPYGAKTVVQSGVNWANPFGACPALSGLTCAAATPTGNDPYPIPTTFNFNFLPTGAFLSNSELFMKAPMLQQWNLSVQKQFGSSWSATVSYVGNFGTHIFVNGDENTGEYFPGTASVGGGTGCSFVAGGNGVFDGTTLVDGVTKAGNPCTSTANLAQRQRLHILRPGYAPEVDYGAITLDSDSGTEHYAGLLMTLQKRMSKDVSFVANYTFSHCTDDGETSEEGAAQAFRYNEPRNVGSCSWDHRHQFSVNALLTTPKFENKMVNLIAGNWSAAPIASYVSGDWLTVTTGTDSAFVGISGGQYANQILANPIVAHTGLPIQGTPGHITSGQLGVKWFNPSAFAAPTATAGFTGNTVCNGLEGGCLNVGPLGGRKASILGPNAFNVDLALTKTVKINEHNQVDLRFEAFNVFNIVRYYDPVVVNPSTATFGQSIIVTPTEPGFNQPQDPRIMQFALKYTF